MSLKFDSHETGEAFTVCCDCGCTLQDASMYIINQSYDGEECIFELAMCLDCREKINEQLSEKSRVAMFDFMADHADLEDRQAKLGTHSETDSETDAYIEKCITCETARSTTRGYTVGAMFSGHHLLKGPFPMLICCECEAKMAETISDETREVWDKFIAEHFPGPPSEINIPTGTKPLLI